MALLFLRKALEYCEELTIASLAGSVSMLAPLASGEIMAASGSTKLQPKKECEIGLITNMIAAERAYSIAVQARSNLVIELLNNRSHESGVAHRNALAYEHRSLKNYLRALRQYSTPIG